MSYKKMARGRPSKFPPEFRRDAVAMVLDEDRPIAVAGRSLGVNPGTLGNWVAQERIERGERQGSRSRIGRIWPSCALRTRSCGWNEICCEENKRRDTPRLQPGWCSPRGGCRSDTCGSRRHLRFRPSSE